MTTPCNDVNVPNANQFLLNRPLSKGKKQTRSFQERYSGSKRITAILYKPTCIPLPHQASTHEHILSCNRALCDLTVKGNFSLWKLWLASLLLIEKKHGTLNKLFTTCLFIFFRNNVLLRGWGNRTAVLY
eukprot:m.7957 g.7957  ORF g.7957 m.7957 type:complete len:130 (-) comp2972_c0_seq1:46-435(-)